MISIIVSSINTEQNLIFKKNIEETIGTPYELLIHDNRELQWGLCKIYNHYALISKYDILCFFHEDTRFHSINWGCIISDFFQQTPIAGVIGFAGSTIKTRQLSGWGSHKETSRENIIQHFKDNKVKYLKCNPYNETFSPVAVIDGLAMITTKKIWKQCPFDEVLFTRFHLYDLDFSMQVAQHYTNYVCQIIKIEHLSNGNYTVEWFQESIKFHQKWKAQLPFSVIPYPEEFIQKCEDFSFYQMTKNELKYWEQCNISSIIKKQSQVIPILYKLKLIKHIIKAGGKKLHKSIQHQTKLSNQKVKYGK